MTTFWSPLDLLDSDSIQAVVAAGLERFGTIDVLLNNAGYGAYGPLEATPMSVLRRQFDVNVFGLVETSIAAPPHRHGLIVGVCNPGRGATTMWFPQPTSPVSCVELLDVATQPGDA